MKEKTSGTPVLENAVKVDSNLVDSHPAFTEEAFHEAVKETVSTVDANVDDKNPESFVPEELVSPC